MNGREGGEDVAEVGEFVEQDGGLLRGAGSAIANLLGYLDLRSQVVERIKWASEQSDDALRLQRVQWQRSASLMSVGAYGQALTLMEQVRSDLGDDISAMDGPTLSAYGSTHLRSAILAARASRMNAPGYAQDA
jgi:hypothetical protein